MVDTGLEPSGKPLLAPQSRRRFNRRRATVTTLQYGILVLLAVLTLVPVFLMIVLSLRPGLLIYIDFWRQLWPFPTYFGNYDRAVSSLIPPMLRTLGVAFVSIAGVLTISAFASYAFARIRFPGSGALFYIVLIVMMIPATILLTPNFILANQLHLVRSLWGLIVFYVAGGLPFAIFLITTFFRAQPSEIFEAAQVDGATDLQALRQIAVPLAFPILVTVAIMNFLSIYGDYIWPSLILTRSNQTLIMALQAFNPQIGAFSTRPDFGVQSAGYVIATAPQAILFVLGMKYFVRGITSGAVKA